jgi:MscS family membrane protein
MIATLVPIGFRYATEYVLTVRGTPLYVASFAANVVALLAGMVVVVGIGNRIAESIIASPKIHPQGLDAQFIRIVTRLLTMVAIVIVFLEGGRYLGIPITTLLAGAGIGGLAIALAAQSTLKDLLGTMMILLDKPYRVGERIILTGYDGFVDEIGLRSTKIRLLTGHMASIPNDLMAQSAIENVGRRPHIRRVSDIHIPLDTPRAKVEKAIAAIRTALDAHEGMDPDFPPRVYFNEFNSDSFNIRVIYWYRPPDYWDFLAESQRVNVEILRAFEEQGIRFTLPLRMTGLAAEGERPALGDDAGNAGASSNRG